MTRLSLLSPLLLALAQPCWAQRHADPATDREIPAFEVPAAQPGVTYQRFLAMGDMGTGRADQRRVAEQMAARAEREPIDFMITLGDNFYPAGVQSADDPMWETHFERIYAAESLQVPIYASLGNHDHGGNTQAQVDYSSRSERWKLPAPYHTFTKPLDDGEVVQFFVLDTTPIARAYPGFRQQLEWLEAELAKSSARWRVVFGHHPLYSHVPRRGHNRLVIHLLEHLFVRYGVDLYIAGHDHILDVLKPVRGVHYLVSGAAAGPDKAYKARWTDESYYTATNGGFSALRISSNEIVMEMIRMDGETEYAHVLRKPPRLGPY
jgi:acid phosphatase